jgi:hypothetical protein
LGLLALLISQSPLPASVQDLEDRVILRFEVGYAPLFAGFSGEPNTQGNIVGETEERARSMFLESSLAFGTRGIGLSTLNTYFLGGMRWDVDGARTPAASPDILYRYEDARQFVFHLIYGELAGFTREGILSNIFLRGGRQFHWGTAAVTFDGATLGYRDDKLEVMFRGGRRSAIFDLSQDDPGLVFGASANYTFGQVRLSADFTHFQRELVLFERDLGIAEGREMIDVKATTGELRGDFELSRTLAFWAQLSFVSPGLSHARLGADALFGPVMLLLDIDQKVGRDLYYDLAGGTGYERNELRATYETFRLNIPDRAAYTHAELSALLPLLDWLEADLTPGVHYVYGAPEKRSPFDASSVFGSAGLHGRFVLDEANGLETDLSYSGMYYLRGDDPTGTFRDDDMGAEKVIHEASAGLRYTNGARFVRRRLLGGRVFSAGVLGYLRSAVIDSRLIESVTDAVYGGIAEVSFSFTNYTKVDAVYEYTRDSQIFVPELADFHRVRVSLEGRF